MTYVLCVIVIGLLLHLEPVLGLHRTRAQSLQEAHQTGLTQLHLTMIVGGKSVLYNVAGELAGALEHEIEMRRGLACRIGAQQKIKLTETKEIEIKAQAEYPA